MSSDVHPTRTAEHGTYGRWRVARVQGYGIVAAAAACMPACSEGITAVIAPLGTVNQVCSLVRDIHRLASQPLTENRTTELGWRLSMKIRFSSEPVSRRQFLLTGDKGF